MALLQRTRLLSQQRVDLTDYNAIEDFVCADFKAIHRNVWTTENFIMSGFSYGSSLGSDTLSIDLAGSSAMFGQGDGTLFIGAPSLTKLETTALAHNTINYIELIINQDTGGADSRAFWDQTANAGNGAEFSQIVDTFIFLDASLSINTTSFTGDTDKIPLCQVTTGPTGTIIGLQDSRNMFWRLGRRGNAEFAYPWDGRDEPVPGAAGGADRSLENMKDWADAVMDSLREIRGTTYWFEESNVSLTAGFRNSALSILTGLSTTARFKWTGTELLFTDDNGAPDSEDELASIRLLDTLSELKLTRQDGQDGSVAFNLLDGEVLWVELPDTVNTNRTYNEQGTTPTDFQTSARGSVPLDDTTYWIAYREGTKVFLRGLGELEPGEERQVNDETTTALLTFLGFDPETATSVPYTAFPDLGSYTETFTTDDDLVTAISALVINANIVALVLDENVYSEFMTVTAALPANDNEIQFPVVVNDIIDLPLDSRDSNSIQEYIVGNGTLEVFLNGLYLCLGEDYNEVGAPEAISTQIQILDDLIVDEKLQFRIDTKGGFNIGGGGGLGDITGAVNVGTGPGEVFKQEVAGILELRKIKAGPGISIITSGDDIIISATGGGPEGYFVNLVTGQAAAIINVGNTYNQGTNKLATYRNGILMYNTNSPGIGFPVDRYQEATNTQIISEVIPNVNEVFTFVNQGDDLTSYQIATGLTLPLLGVPNYVIGNASLRVWRNGILMNAAGLGAATDKYTESSVNTITLVSTAVASDVFLYQVGPDPSNREDVTGLVGANIPVSDAYVLGLDEMLVYKNGVLMHNSNVAGDPVDRYQEASVVSIALEVDSIAGDVWTFLHK